jgi:hypothetical protein
MKRKEENRSVSGALEELAVFAVELANKILTLPILIIGSPGSPVEIQM